LGFVPVNPAVGRLVEREEHRMSGSAGYRSSRSTLEKLAAGYMRFDGPAAQPGAWDGFDWRKVGFKAQRKIGRSQPRRLWDAVLAAIPHYPSWTAVERRQVDRILSAKQGPEESRYLRLLQRHATLREAVLRLGSG
jgi:hypothetical protein